jgi:hypothetical protein
MTYDADLAERVRHVLEGETGITEKHMFGGLAFLLDGHLVDLPHARPFEMRGRAMTGWLHVDDERLATEAELKRWVERGVAFARTLPPT